MKPDRDQMKVTRQKSTSFVLCKCISFRMRRKKHDCECKIQPSNRPTVVEKIAHFLKIT